MEWMILPLKRYFDFRGRSRRKEYWMYTLFVLIASMILGFLDGILGFDGTLDQTQEQDPAAEMWAALLSGWLGNIFTLATFIPGTAVAVRRLHDIDRSGWWVLLPAVPSLAGLILIGYSLQELFDASNPSVSTGAYAGMALLGAGGIASILLLIWYCTDGTTGPNRFGVDPKGPADNAEEVFG